MRTNINIVSNFLSEDKLRSRFDVATYAQKHDTAAEDTGVDYEGESIIPLNDWQPIDEETALVFGGDVRLETTLGLFQTNQKTADEILDLSNNRAIRTRDRLHPADIFGLRLELAAALKDVEGITLVGPLMDIAGGKFSPNLTTTTLGGEDLRVGLHIDSWDALQKPQPGGRIPSNRIGLNAGENDRFLLFLPYSLNQIRDWAAALSEPPEKDLIGAFLQGQAIKHVYRMRVAPNEFYIAPTENLIHDGSTLGGKTDDIVVFIRGHILAGQTDHTPAAIEPRGEPIHA